MPPGAKVANKYGVKSERALPPSEATIDSSFDEADPNAHQSSPVEPLQQPFSRLQLLRYGAVATVAAAEATSAFGGIVWFVKRSTTPAARIMTARQNFVDMLVAQPMAETVVAEIYAIPGVGRYIDLAQERINAGVTDGRLAIGVANTGNSFTYSEGVRNDGGGLFHQPHAISSVAMDGLDDDARKELGIGAVTVAADAQIGATSAVSFPDDPSPPYGFLSEKQLRNPAVQDFLRHAPGLAIERRDLELDDLRRLIANSAELASLMDNVVAVLTDDKAERSAEAQLEWVRAQVPAIARGATENYLTAASILGEISVARLQSGQSRIVHVPVLCWDIGDSEQARIPANTTSDKPNANAQRYLTVDPTGPNRFFLEVSSIPYGHQIAHWVWVELMHARAEGIRQVRRLYGDTLGVVPENLLRVNRLPNFYWTALLGQKGNGHEGPHGIVDMARAELGLFQNRTAEGILVASTLAALKPPQTAT